MQNDRIEILDFPMLIDYLRNGAIVTLEIDNQRINIVRKVKLPLPVLVIQHYGEYPFETALMHLTGRNNIKVYVYRQPPATEYCEITKRLIDFWVKGV